VTAVWKQGGDTTVEKGTNLGQQGAEKLASRSDESLSRGGDSVWKSSRTEVHLHLNCS